MADCPKNTVINIVHTHWPYLKLKLQILWPHYGKNWFLRKDLDAGKDWRQEEKRTTEDEVVGWHHQLDRHEFEQAPGVGDGQGSLVCWSSWECKESDMTDWLNNKCFLFFFTSWTFPLRFSFFCDKNTPFSCFYERSVGQGHNFFLTLLSKNIFFHPQFLKYVNDRFYL